MTKAKTKTHPVKFHETAAELLVPADAVRPHPANPNNSDTDQIMLSMRRNGVYRPIYAQRSTGFILAGHGTYAAMLELGCDEVPVAWVDCDTRTADRIVAVDNRSAQLARMDDGLLVQLLQGLDGDLAGTGYTDDDLAKLMGVIDDDDLDGGDPELGEGSLSIVVECDSEDQQAMLLERFEAEGLTCKPLMM